jgi:hypothetical protein
LVTGFLSSAQVADYTTFKCKDNLGQDWLELKAVMLDLSSREAAYRPPVTFPFQLASYILINCRNTPIPDPLTGHGYTSKVSG